ncbi:Protein of unknown function [Gryllus bimaculatus]|nr:Protein of unknown function [Gryllus bimaculatus]
MVFATRAPDILHLTCKFQNLLEKLDPLVDARNELERVPANAETYQVLGNVFFPVPPAQLKKEMDEEIAMLQEDTKKIFESIATLNIIKEPIQKKLDELIVSLQFLATEK